MKKIVRPSGRKSNELRKWKITCGVLDYAHGSALIEAGKTRVLCAASLQEKVPPFLKNQGKGWVTAEYAMLPCSTQVRSNRERGARIGGRTMEIQRLIGRSLRAVTDLTRLGECTVTVDCDVIQADGGTRVAAISGAWLALSEAVHAMILSGAVAMDPMLDSVAAVSVGVLDGEAILDLDYEEDSVADVDMNVVMTGSGKLVEVQATAEHTPFSVARLNSMIRLAQKGIKEIEQIQVEALKQRLNG